MLYVLESWGREKRYYLFTEIAKSEGMIATIGQEDLDSNSLFFPSALIHHPKGALPYSILDAEFLRMYGCRIAIFKD